MEKELCRSTRPVFSLRLRSEHYTSKFFGPLLRIGVSFLSLCQLNFKSFEACLKAESRAMKLLNSGAATANVRCSRKPT